MVERITAEAGVMPDPVAQEKVYVISRWGTGAPTTGPLDSRAHCALASRGVSTSAPAGRWTT